MHATTTQRWKIDRIPFALIGITLAAIKFGLDWWVSHAFDKQWSLARYVSGLAHPLMIEADDRSYWLTLLAVALPFMFAGLLLTIARLRAIDASPLMVGVFFVPWANLLFFAVLSLLPSSSDRRPADRGRSAPPDGDSWRGILLGSGAGVLVSLFSIFVLGSYGWALFLGVPFFIGFIAVVCSATHSKGHAVVKSASAVFLSTLVFFAFGLEGAICILMALPPGLALGILGGVIAYGSHHPTRPHERRTTAIGMTIALPLLVAAEGLDPEAGPVHQVASTIVIDAPPESVWKHVVSFSEIPEPRDWLFRTGIAYPVRARIDGRGVGAVRYCEFTTGTFVEPIEVWDQPERLAFGVRKQPEPMKELSPYTEVAAHHLEGYFQAVRGEFRLLALPAGRTKLVGTTWYEHRLQPTAYWRLWSDWIIHRIHQRVLEHIATLAQR